jgi:putative transposase
MSEYRRCFQPGGTYFFTVVTYERRPIFQDAMARTLLGATMRDVAEEFPFQTFATVLLPDHLHCVWTLPTSDSDFSGRWNEIKGRFTKSWLESGGADQPVTSAQAARRRRGIWQRRFWEHTVRDETDLERCCDYIHYNPVKHGYVARLADWPWSSFHRFVRAGHYPPDWGRTEPPTIAGAEWE